jgi:hypothetical protein
MIFLFFTFLLSALGSIQDCNTSSVFQLTTLDLVPASPIPGQPLAMTVQFNNPGPVVRDGTVTTSLTYNFIPFSPTTEALCTNTACPLITGFNDRSTTNPWPDVTGSVTSVIKWNLDEENLLCIKLSVKTANKLRGNFSFPGQLDLLNVFQGKGTAEQFEEMSTALIVAPSKELVVYRRATSKVPEL